MKRLLSFFRDHIIEYLFIAILFGGVFYLAFAHGSYARADFDPATEYVNKIFDNSYVHKVEITISEDDYQNLLAEPREKTKYHTTVLIDGEKFDDVAFSARGNGTLVQALADHEANDDTSLELSYTLNFKKFNKKSSYHGLDKLILSRLYYERSYLRSYLALHLSAAVGLDIPLSSFTEVYINGELSGLYLALEGIDNSFLNRTGSSKTASLFHPLPYSIDWDKRYRDEQYLAPDEHLDVNEEPLVEGYDFGGADLAYHGDDPADYPAIFENATTKYSAEDAAIIIAGLKSLQPGADAETHWDIDAVLKFFAAAAVAPNSDSYLGPYAQNYYLKISDGKLSLVPWDFDSSFFAVDYTRDDPFNEGAIYWPIDDPVFYISQESRPLWMLVATNPNYLARYHRLIQTALDNYLLTGDCLAEFNATADLIRPYAYADPSRHYTIDEFEDEVLYLRDFITLRADSLQKQLWSLEPKTRN